MFAGVTVVVLVLACAYWAGSRLTVNEALGTGWISGASTGLMLACMLRARARHLARKRLSGQRRVRQP